MKELHFYASDDFVPFGSSQNDLRPTSSLAPWMLHVITQEVLQGKPPFKLTIARDAAWNAMGSGFPEALFDVSIVPGKTESQDPKVLCDPFDTATIECGDTQIIIHFRRAHTTRPWHIDA